MTNLVVLELVSSENAEKPGGNVFRHTLSKKVPYALKTVENGLFQNAFFSKSRRKTREDDSPENILRSPNPQKSAWMTAQRTYLPSKHPTTRGKNKHTGAHLFLLRVGGCHCGPGFVRVSRGLKPRSHNVGPARGCESQWRFVTGKASPT